MNILLQRGHSKLYFSLANRWTKKRAEAQIFRSAKQVCDKAKELRLPDAQALYTFDDEGCSFATPCVDWSQSAKNRSSRRRFRREHVPTI